MKYFRSIAVLGALEDAAYARSLGAWIERHDAFQRRELGFDQAKNLHLAVGRAISFYGEGAISAAPQALGLCALGKKLGYGTAVRIAIEEALSDPCAYEALVFSESPASSIMLDAGPKLGAGRDAAVRRLVLRVIESRKSLSLIGPVSYWLDSGVLDLSEVNGESFTLAGAARQAVAAGAAAAFDPCSARFQVFIDAAGYLYPCQGLVGLEAASLGRVTDRGENALPGADWPRLRSWARTGPALASGQDCSPPGPLPAVCRGHRLAISAAQR